MSFNRIVHTRIIAYTNNIQENMVIFENDSSEESSIPRKERGDRRHQIKKSKTELSSKEHSCQYNDRSKLTKE